MSPSQTIAATMRHGRLSVPTECAQGVRCKKKRRKQLPLYSETLLKNTVYYRDLQADFQDMLHHALSTPRLDFKSADMLRKFSDSILMDVHLKMRAGGGNVTQEKNLNNLSDIQLTMNFSFLHSDNLNRSE